MIEDLRRSDSATVGTDGALRWILLVARSGGAGTLGWVRLKHRHFLSLVASPLEPARYFLSTLIFLFLLAKIGLDH
ncbi:hypothetical protein VH88_08590 [Brevundimonas sp. KM4]|nr:hypothetical protein VH88_08590 [Brevundimonas sp. KM4]